jgi:hypothetical protein
MAHFRHGKSRSDKIEGSFPDLIKADTMDAFNEALRGWQNFYFMMGGAAATLAGLMFVALSLGQHLISDQTKSQMKLFAMPSIIYFVSVLLLAGIMLVPIFTPTWMALVLFLSGGYGFLRVSKLAVFLFRAALRNADFTVADWLAQIIGPVASYALLLIAALFFVLDQATLGLIALGIVAIVLLLSAIANTWSLVIWIVEQPRP